METVRALDRIIRSVQSRPKVLSTSEKFVMIDCKTRKATAARPWFGLGEVKSFLVVNENSDARMVELKVPTIPVQEIEHDDPIGLNFTCWASCPEGKEETLAEALYDPELTPSDKFDRLIGRWVDDFVHNDPGDFISQYFERKNTLRDYIVERARTQMGLKVQLRLALEDEDSSFEIRDLITDSFLIRAKDYHEPQDLTISCKLEIEPSTKIYANVYRKRVPALTDALVHETQSFFERNVTLEQFYDDLNQRDIVEPLKKILNERLRQEGRVLGFFHLKSTAIDSAPKEFELERDVEVKVQEFPEKITIKNHALMTRTDVAIYKSKDSPKLGDWLTEKLKKIIPDTLFYVKYIDLLIDFLRPDDEEDSGADADYVDAVTENADDEDDKNKRLKKKIRDRLRAEAKAIGYKLKYLTTIPDLKPLTWLEPFTIDAGGRFESKVSRFFVEVTIPVTVRFTTLDNQKIRNLLNRQDDIPERMRVEAHDVIGQFLHTVEPERFYTTFLHPHPDPNKYDGAKAIEQDIILKIRETLDASFACEVISVVPKMVETEPITRWLELQEKVCDFSFEVTPFRGGQAIPFSGKFQVEHIAEKGWDKFQNRKFTIDDLKTYLEASLCAALKTASKEELLFRGSSHLKKLHDEINNRAASAIEKVYGVVISITMIDRKFTRIETAINNELGEREISSIVGAQSRRLAAIESDSFFAEKKGEEIRKLIQERLDLGVDAPEDEIEELESRIHAERDKLNPDLIPSIGSIEQMLNPDVPAEDRLLDLPQYRLLKERKNGDQNGEEHDDE